MCLGAIPWSGIKTIVYGSPKEDVEEIAGFDEGTIPDNWKENLEKRSISVHGPLLAEKTGTLLEAYRGSGAVIY